MLRRTADGVVFDRAAAEAAAGRRLLAWASRERSWLPWRATAAPADASRLASIGADLGVSASLARAFGRPEPAAQPSTTCATVHIKPALRWLGEEVRRLRPNGWGDVLDSGTGRGSLCWLLSQPCRAIVAISAMDANSAYGVDPLRLLASSAPASAPKAELLLGNWKNTSLVGGKLFDVVSVATTRRLCTRVACCLPAPSPPAHPFGRTYTCCGLPPFLSGAR